MLHLSVCRRVSPLCESVCSDRWPLLPVYMCLLNNSVHTRARVGDCSSVRSEGGVCACLTAAGTVGLSWRAWLICYQRGAVRLSEESMHKEKTTEREA